MKTATITSNTDTNERLARLIESDAKALEASKASLKSKYGLTDAELSTLIRVDFGGKKPSKLQVTYACRTCGKPVTRFTSDLFVVDPSTGKAKLGVIRDCTDCLNSRKGDKTEDHKAMRELMAQARKAGIPVLVDGKLNPELVAQE